MYLPLRQKQYCITAIFLGLIAFAQAQERGTGMTFDDAAYRKITQQPRFGGAKFNDIPPSVNLRKYCPKVGDQGATNACVGWSVGYAALTICRAIQTGKTQISDIQPHSAAFVYNQIKQGEGCKAGASLSQAFDLMSKSGNCTAQSFRSNARSCDEKPDAKATNEAAIFRIKDYAILFSPDTTAKVKIAKIKQQLAAQNPVVVGLLVDVAFSKPFEKNTWKVDSSTLFTGSNSGHSMVVVGYNDSLKAFELMNSWGNKWGDEGFIWISYNDFSKVVKYGFIMTLDEKLSLNNGKPRPMTTTELLTASAESFMALTGEFAYRNVTSITEKSDGSLTIQFAEVKATYNAKRQVYECTKKWRVGDTFQLVARRVPKGKYVYVFSQDAVGKIDMHYPLSTNDFSQFMPSPDAEIILPSEEDALQLTQRGEDLIGILYADRAIKDFSTRLNKFKLEQGSFREKLDKTFGDLLVKKQNVEFAPFEMRFNSLSKAQQGSVVALVLSVIAE
jgi:hypothetical protein